MPIGPLVDEHRLIERLNVVMKRELERMKAGGKLDERAVDVAVDFMRTYAEGLHHGKEEGILFKTLGGKPMSAEHRRVMAELVEEHAYLRNRVTQLAAAKELHVEGSSEALHKVIQMIAELIGFYPTHMEKEERGFFAAAMGYLTGEEKVRMLEEMREFDRRLIHDKYRYLVEGMERDYGGRAGMC